MSGSLWRALWVSLAVISILLTGSRLSATGDPHSITSSKVVSQPLALNLTESLWDLQMDLNFTIMAQSNDSTLLTQSEIEEKLQHLSGWEIKGKTLECQRRFNNFVEAIAFINKLVEPSEMANHHPDLYISYNRVNITLTTHDIGGLTEKDFALAQAISQIT